MGFNVRGLFVYSRRLDWRHGGNQQGRKEIGRRGRTKKRRCRWTSYLVPRPISPLRISAEAAVPARLDMDKPNGPFCSLRGSGTASWLSPLSFPGSPAVPLGSFQLRPDHCPWPRDCTEHPGLHEIVKRANALMECLALESTWPAQAGQQLASQRQRPALGRIHDEQLLLDPYCMQTGIMGQRHPFCPST